MFFVHCGVLFFPLYLAYCKSRSTLTLELEPVIFAHLNSTEFLSKYKKLYQTNKRTAHRGISTLWQPGGGAEVREGSGGLGQCSGLKLHARRTENREKEEMASPDIYHQQMELEGVHQMLLLQSEGSSYRVCCYYFYLLSTDAKLISGGEGTGSLTISCIYFLYVFIFFLCGQKDILFQHSIIFYTETV